MKRYAFRSVLGLALVVGALCATGRAQDLTTQLSLFLVDLRAGILGNTQTFGTLKLASGGIGTAANTTITATAAGTVSLTGTTPLIQLGGTTASFAAIKNTGGTLDVVTADNSAFTAIRGLSLNIQSGGNINFNGTAVAAFTAPTISSGFGTSPAILSSNGTTSFRVNVGTGGVATSGVIGLPAATTGWNCQVTDMGPGAIDATRQTASTTTTVTVGASAAWAASDTLIFNCSGY